MSNEEWWTATRKASEYWHKCGENQIGAFGKGNALMRSGSQADLDGLLLRASAAIADSGCNATSPLRNNRNTWLEWD